MHTRTTENIINELVTSMNFSNTDSRGEHVFFQALHGLVRFAKTEQMLEIKMNVEKATGAMEGNCHRQAKELLRKIGINRHAGNDQFQLDKTDSASIGRQGRE